MMNMNMNAYTRLTNEFQACVNDEDLVQIGCTFGLVNPNDFFKWKVTMIGPQDSPYAGGLFIIIVEFPKDYPCHGPEFIFENKIYHLNVNFTSNHNYKQGHICLNSLNEWRVTGQVKDQPNFGVKQALFEIFCLFYNQGTDGPYDTNMAELYKKNPQQFNENVKKWVRDYAMLTNNSFSNNC